MNNPTAFKFTDDLVKIAIYYFSKLPAVEQNTTCNRLFGKLFGVVLILESYLIVGLQFLLMKYQWNALMRNGEKDMEDGFEWLYYVKPGMQY